MIKLYPEQLQKNLDKELREAYLLLGNDFFLLQESRDAIRKKAKTQGFLENKTFHIDNNSDWQKIFSICQSRSFFSKRQTLQILLPESDSNIVIDKQMSILVNFLHKDLLLIIQEKKSKKSKKNINWLNELAHRHSALIICQTPERMNLLRWVEDRAKKNNLNINKNICNFLCYCYEGNLLAMAQVLEQLSLLYPEEKLTLPLVKRVVNDAARFTPFQWVDAILEEKSKRALHILQRLQLEDRDPVVLLRILQHNLLLLITIKRQSICRSLRMVFDEHQIWQARRALMTKALKRLSQNQLRNAIHLMTRIELTLQQDCKQSVWLTLESLSLLLCNKSLADIFIKDSKHGNITNIVWWNL